MKGNVEVFFIQFIFDKAIKVKSLLEIGVNGISSDVSTVEAFFSFTSVNITNALTMTSN